METTHWKEALLHCVCVWLQLDEMPWENQRCLVIAAVIMNIYIYAHSLQLEKERSIVILREGYSPTNGICCRLKGGILNSRIP